MKATKHKYFAYEDEQTATRRVGEGAMSLAISYSCSIIRRRVEHEDTIITSSTPHSEYSASTASQSAARSFFKSALMALDTFRERSRLSTLWRGQNCCRFAFGSLAYAGPFHQQILREAIYQNELINPADCSRLSFHCLDF